MKWQYHIQDISVIRQFSVKWWDKFKHQLSIEHVDKALAPKNQKAKSVKQKALKASPTQSVNTPAVKQPTVKSKAQPEAESSSSSAELIALAQKLLAQASQMESQKSEGSCSNEPEPFDPFDQAFQDAQDPYADSE